MKAKFSKATCLVLALTMMLAVGNFSVSAANDIVPTMTFNESVGGWTAVTYKPHSSTTLETAADPNTNNAGNRVLYYSSTTDGTTKNNTGVELQFTPQNGNIVEQQVDFYTGSANTERKFFYVVDGAGITQQIFQISQSAYNATLMYAHGQSDTTVNKTLDKDTWYTFKIIVNTTTGDKYLLYKKVGDTAWTDASGVCAHNETKITSVKGIRIGNSSVATMMFYLDNYSAKVITQDELVSTLMNIYGSDTSYLTVPTKTLTQNSQLDGTKLLYTTGETSGITEINFKYKIPEFTSGQTRICFTENTGGAAYNYGRRELFDINFNGGMRARVGSGGTTNWMYSPADTLTVGEAYDFKLVAYLDTATYEVYYKKSSETSYKSFAETLKLGGIDTTDNFGTYYSDDLEKLNSITTLEILTPADAGKYVSNVTVTCYATPGTVIAKNNEFLFKVYHDALRNAGIVKNTFNPITDAANLTAITTNGITGSQNILLASTCPAIYTANSINYSAAKESANADAITAAVTEATALVNGNILTNANKYVRKVLLLNGLKSEAAAMNLYFADASMRETASLANAKYAVVDGVTENSAGILFIVAYGEGDVLKDISAFNEVKAGTYLPVAYQLPSGTTSVKAFIWRGLDTLVPLTAAVSK